MYVRLNWLFHASTRRRCTGRFESQFSSKENASICTHPSLFSVSSVLNSPGHIKRDHCFSHCSRFVSLRFCVEREVTKQWWPGRFCDSNLPRFSRQMPASNNDRCWEIARSTPTYGVGLPDWPCALIFMQISRTCGCSEYGKFPFGRRRWNNFF